jgi:hypothetical protein
MADLAGMVMDFIKGAASPFDYLYQNDIKNPNMQFWLNCSAGSYKIVPTDKWQRFKILSNKKEIGQLLMDWQKYYLVDVELK